MKPVAPTFNVRRFLNRLRESGIVLQLDGEDNIDIDAPKGVLLPMLLQEIIDRKQELLDYLRSARQPLAGVTEIPPAPVAEYYPLSSSQFRVWLTHEARKSAGEYNISSVIDLKGGWDPGLLEQAIVMAVHRHEILRTVFREDEKGEVKQWVLPANGLPLDIRFTDLRTEPLRYERMHETIADAVDIPFNLSVSPLFRVHFYRTEEQLYFLHYVMHHIISDGWSLNVLTQDVMRFYEALRDGRSFKPEPLQIHYKDYAVWQQQQLQTGIYLEHQSYWKNHLQGDFQQLDLVPSSQRPAVRTTRGRMLRTTISATLSIGLRDFCVQSGGSLFMGLTAIVRALLYRYSGQNDLVLGTPIAGRQQGNLHNQIGFYVNTLALRTPIEAGDSFFDLFEHTRKDVIAAYEHQDYPFDRLVEDLQLPMDRSRNTLFDVMVGLQNYNENATDPKAKDVTDDEIIDRGGAKSTFDLLFDFHESGDGLEFYLLYNEDIYEDPMMRRLMTHFKNLLSSCLTQPRQPVGKLAYLNEEERALLLSFNDTDVPYRHTATILDLFDEQVRSSPGALALTTASGNITYTYRELDEEANRLARHLVGLALPPQSLVPVCLDRSPELVIALLGVLKAGCAYVPIDPDYPQERIDYILHDTSAQVLITHSHYRETETGQSLFYVYMDGARTFSDEKPDVHLPASAPNDLAYCIYTSGSTGRPKGVLIEHTSVVNLMQWHAKRYGVDGRSRSTLMAGVGFDACALELWSALLNGAALYLVPDALKLDSEALVRFYSAQHITHAFVPPALLPALVAVQPLPALALRYVLVGGDRLPALEVAGLPYTVVNQYGPTESTVMVTEQAVTDSAAPPPIGRPLSNTQVYVLDSDGELLPAGVAGELYIGGVQLARGYWNNASLTAAKFVAHPFQSGARLYRSGDRGRWTATGALEYLGRLDEQVKIRGYRIEPAEVEGALQGLAGVGTAAVVVGGAAASPYLVGYYTAEGGLEPAQVRSALQAVLPSYLVPSRLEAVERLPLTPNGKVDRKTLVQWDRDWHARAATEASGPDTQPRSDIEKKIMLIWQDLLLQPVTEANCDFFALGGNSLQVMQLMNTYYKDFDVKLSIDQLFENPTPAGHAGLVREAGGTRYAPIAKVAEAADYPVSDGQRRLWMLCQSDEVSRAYNIPGFVELSGNYKPALFEKAVRAVVERHEALRTVFVEKEGELRQVILSPEKFAFSLDYRDFSDMATEDIQRYRSVETLKLFDLAKGPLVKAELLRTSSNKYIFYYNIHHIVSDGWSMGLLEKEVLACYAAYEQNLLPNLSPLRIQYKDYAAWQLQEAGTGNMLAQRDYWLEQLSGELPVLSLPGKQRPAVLTNNGHTLSSTIDAALVTRLRDYCRQNNATLFMGLLAVLKILLYRYTGQGDIVIGSPIAGRQHEELENQIGFYINTLVLRTRFTGSDPFEQVLEQVRSTTLAAYQHQAYSFDRLVGDLNISYDPSRSPVEVAVTLQNYQQRGMASHTDDGGIRDLGPVRSKIELHFTFEEVGDALDIYIQYNTDIYEHALIRGMIRHFKSLLSSCLAQPQQPVGKLVYLNEEEKALLLSFNDTDVPYRHTATILDLFDEQVRSSPDAPAIITAMADEQLTYQELDEQAGKLAHYLVARGVQPQELVPVCLDRSPELVIALLGVLKAGCAYVPIDPDYPQERIDYMIRDCGARLLITHSYYNDKETPKEYAAICIDRDWFQIENQSFQSLPVSAPNDLAYCIYTSGSTGRPKGVLIEHTAVVNLMEWHAKRYGVDGRSRSTLMAGVGFDACALELWSALLNGAALYLVPDALKLDSEALVRFYAAQHITHAFVPPALLPALVAVQPLPALALRYVLVGGDRLPALEVGGLPYTVVNQYGPTESTVMVTEQAVTDSAVPPPIGRPLSNTQVYVLDSDGALLPAGVAGELYIGGVQLARGYWNNAALTAAKFVAHPFRSGARLYRSGDRGRWTATGALEYLGRLDEQVKIRGYRIEPAEVEGALQGVAGVGTAAVVVGGAAASPYLVGYYTAEGELEQAQVRSALQTVLPSYLVPARLEAVERLPLTANGKVDRKTLVQWDRDWQQEQQEAAADDTTAASEVEAALCAAYGAVLERAQVGVGQSFFDLGGDSIKAILLVNRLKQRGYGVKVGDVLRYPVVRELALHTQPLLNDANPQQQLPVEGIVPLTPIQRRFLNSDHPGKHHYNQSVLLQSEERIDTVALNTALEALCHHHDALRMIFPLQEPGTRQQYNRPADAAAYTLQVTDLRDDPYAAQQMEAYCAAVQSSIDLEAGPLLKAALFRLDDNDQLLLVVHHLVVDGVSWRLLLEDLTTAYLQASVGDAVQLPAKSDSFLLWAQRLYSYVDEGGVKSEQAYWKDIAARAAAGKGVSLDKQGGHNLLMQSRALSFGLDARLTEALQGKVHRVYQTQIDDVLLAALGLAVKKVFNNADRLLVQLEGHGREQELLPGLDISRTVGWFTSVYPVVLPLLDTPPVDSRTILDYVVTVKEELRRVPGKGLGYSLLKYIEEDRELAEMAADITFNYLGDFGSGVRSGEGEEVFRHSPNGRGAELHEQTEADTPITLSGYTASGELHINLVYSEEQFAPATMQALLQAYESVLKEIILLLQDQRTGQLTPSDLTYKNLGPAEMALLQRTGRVEDVYTLSPLQEGIYFHWLSRPGVSAYVNQTSYEVQGNLNFDLLHKSFQYLVDRHGILRTAFTHDYGNANLQVVYAHCTCHFEHLLPPAGSDPSAFAQAYKQSDRKKGFDLGEPSQMRLTVIERGPQSYEFIWTHHHILMDGWCASILINEFYTIYQSLLKGLQPALDAPVPYVNYIKWLSGEVKRQQGFDFWRQYLGGYDATASLPLKRSEPGLAARDYLLKTLHLEFSADETDRLKQLCKDFSITEGSFMQAAWGYLLSRYNGTRDVVFGTVVSGRPGELPGVESTIGLFINTIPVRVRYDADTTIGGLLRQVQENAIDALPHHYLPLNEVQAQSNLAGQLFDHVLIYENYLMQKQAGGEGEETAQPETGGLEFLSAASVEQTNYDFNVASGASTRFTVSFSFNEAVYDGKWIAQVGEHFQHVLRHFLHAPETVLMEMSMPGRPELKILESFEGGANRINTVPSVLDLFYEQVDRSPQALAVSGGDGSLSYHALDVRSNQLAHYLQQQGMAPEQSVALLLPRSFELIVAVLGVLKAGCAYVPIDPLYPAQRIAMLVQDSGASLVLTQARYTQSGGAGGEGTVRYVALEQVGLEGWPVSQPATVIRPEQLAYVLYTSGSSGAPKGVMIEHQSLSNLIQGRQEAFAVMPGECILQLANDCLDMFAEQVFLSLSSGATLVLPTAEALSDINLFGQLLRQQSVTHLHATPGFLQDLEPGRYGALRRVVVSGADCPPALAKKWMPFVSFYKQYGMPETGGTITALPVNETGAAQTFLPIGRPVAGASAYVLDANGRRLGIGMPGELYVGGAPLARGYWKDAQLTAEKFISHPFNPDERLYRTGARCRWLADGCIQLVGRLDNQVSIRGYPVALEEIEYQLRQVGGVGDAAVILGGDESFHYLAGYFTATEELDPSSITIALQRTLPAYMVPARLQQLDELPLNHTGTADRKALAALDLQLRPADTESQYTPPANETEAVLCEVYANVLEREQVGVGHSFFDLGGDSIKAILLVNRLKQRGYAVKVADVLSYPLIRELALHTEMISELPASNEQPVEGEVPLTAIQRSFFQSQRRSYHHYNHSVLLSSREPLAFSPLEVALQALVRHHDALRMVFSRDADGNWQQYNRGAGALGYELHMMDLSDRADGPRQMEARCMAIQSSFDLGRGPLLKAALFHLADGDRLLVAVHHSVVDAVSWRILLEDLTTAYLQSVDGSQVKLPRKSDSFLLWSQRLLRHVQEGGIAGEADYWRAVCARAAHGNPLPLDKPAGLHLARSSRMLGFELEEEVTEALLGRIHRVYRTGINDVLLSALGTAVKNVFGSLRVVVQLEGHGREQGLLDGMDISRTVGWFTSVHPVVLPPATDEPLTYVLDIKEELHRVPNKGIGYGLLKYLGEDGGISDVPWDVTFNYLGDFGSGVRSAEGESVFSHAAENRGYELDEETPADTPLVINSYTVSGRLHTSFTYSTEQYEEATVQALATAYEAAVRSLVALLLQQEAVHGSEKKNIHDEASLFELTYNQRNYYHNRRFMHAFGSFHLHLQDFDREAFISAFNGMLADYSVLHARFVQMENGVFQSFGAARDARHLIEFLELDTHDLEDARAQALFHSLTSRPFDLLNGETIRCAVVYNAGEAYVQVVIHHIVTDGYSNNVLRDVLSENYGKRRTKKRNLTPYTSFISAQRRYLQSDEGRAKVEYWNRKLEALSGRRVPVPVAKEVFCEERMIIDGELYQQAAAFCKANDLLLSSFVLAIYYLLLRQSSDPLLIQVITNSRDSSLPGFEIGDAVGQFVSRLPLVLSHSGHPSDDLVRYIQQEYLNGRANQQVPNLFIEKEFEKNTAVRLEALTDQYVNLFDYRNDDLSREAYPTGSRLVDIDEDMPAAAYVSRSFLFRDALVFEMTTLLSRDEAQRRARSAVLKGLPALVAALAGVPIKQATGLHE